MIQYEPWRIRCEGREDPKFLESIFSQSNGYLGSRCTFFMDGAKAYERCNYLAGGFDYISPGVTDMVNEEKRKLTFPVLSAWTTNTCQPFHWN